jgi:hypothetical protein
MANAILAPRRQPVSGSADPCAVVQTLGPAGATQKSAPINPRLGTSFLEQELAHFSNDQCFVHNEHIVAGVMHFDDPRVLHARAEALDCAFYPRGERLDVAIEFLELLQGNSPVL